MATLTARLQRARSHLVDEAAGAIARAVHLRRSQASRNSLHLLPRLVGHDLSGFFPAPERLPQVRVTPAWRRRRMTADHINFASLHRPLVEPAAVGGRPSLAPNREVHGCWFRHTDGRRRATVIWLHPWMVPPGALDDRVILPRLARYLDVDLLRLDLPFHGKRRPHCSRFHGEYFWTADLARTFEAIRQSVTDVRTALRWLRGRTEQPVGVMGQSLGGMMALGAAGFEPEASFCVAVAAHLDLAGVLADASLVGLMRRELGRHGWTPADLRRFMHDVGAYRWRPLIPAERILLVAGEHDRFLRAERVKAQWELWGRPRLHWYPGGHLGIFTQASSYLPVVRDFLRERAASPGAAATTAAEARG